MSLPLSEIDSILHLGKIPEASSEGSLLAASIVCGMRAFGDDSSPLVCRDGEISEIPHSICRRFQDQFVVRPGNSMNLRNGDYLS